jgi:hypothetical protein
VFLKKLICQTKPIPPKKVEAVDELQFEPKFSWRGRERWEEITGVGSARVYEIKGRFRQVLRRRPRRGAKDTTTDDDDDDDDNDDDDNDDNDNDDVDGDGDSESDSDGEAGHVRHPTTDCGCRPATASGSGNANGTRRAPAGAGAAPGDVRVVVDRDHDDGDCIEAGAMSDEWVCVHRSGVVEVDREIEGVARLLERLGCARDADAVRNGHSLGGVDGLAVLDDENSGSDDGDDVFFDAAENHGDDHPSQSAGDFTHPAGTTDAPRLSPTASQPHRQQQPESTMLPQPHAQTGSQPAQAPLPSPINLDTPAGREVHPIDGLVVTERTERRFKCEAAMLADFPVEVVDLLGIADVFAPANDPILTSVRSFFEAEMPGFPAKCTVPVGYSVSFAAALEAFEPWAECSRDGLATAFEIPAHYAVTHRRPRRRSKGSRR